MFVSECFAYAQISITMETMDDHLNLRVRDDTNDNAWSLTLSGSQAATLATGIIEALMKLGEKPDPLKIFGKAKLVRREAA